MKNLILLLLLAICFSCGKKQQETPETDFTQYVDPTIGNVGHILQPTRPTVQLPNQMTRMTPDRADFLDDQISSFPLNVISHRVAQAFFIKPIIGQVSEGSWKKGLTWDHDLEVNRPWYYKTELIDDEGQDISQSSLIQDAEKRPFSAAEFGAHRSDSRETRHADHIEHKEGYCAHRVEQCAECGSYLRLRTGCVHQYTKCTDNIFLRD